MAKNFATFVVASLFTGALLLLPHIATAQEVCPEWISRSGLQTVLQRAVTERQAYRRATCMAQTSNV